MAWSVSRSIIGEHNITIHDHLERLTLSNLHHLFCYRFFVSEGDTEDPPTVEAVHDARAEGSASPAVQDDVRVGVTEFSGFQVFSAGIFPDFGCFGLFLLEFEGFGSLSAGNS